MHESLNTGPPLTTPVTTDVARSVGSVLAHIHRLDLTPTTPVEPWHTARRSKDEWDKLAEDAQRAGAPWAPMLVAALPGLLKLAATPVPADVSTPILTHCNFGPGCIARLGSGELVVSGWEHAGALPAEWELSVAIMGVTDQEEARVFNRSAADVLAEPLTADRLESVAAAIGEVARAPGYA